MALYWKKHPKTNTASRRNRLFIECLSTFTALLCQFYTCFFPRHMCVQLRLLPHARLLKDYHLLMCRYRKFLSLPITLLFVSCGAEGAWRTGYIYHLTTNRTLDFTALLEPSHSTNAIAFCRIYAGFSAFQTTNLRSNPPLTSHSSFSPSTWISPHYWNFAVRLSSSRHRLK